MSFGRSNLPLSRFTSSSPSPSSSKFPAADIAFYWSFLCPSSTPGSTRPWNWSGASDLPRSNECVRVRNFFLTSFVLEIRIALDNIEWGFAMICPNCQKEIVDGSKFCYNCGARLAGPDAPAATPVCPPAKRLMRSSRDKKLGGVCAGIADYFDLDPTIVRVIWLLAVLLGGTGLLAYLILWIVLPLAPSGAPATVPTTPARV
jgi:phage shock protein C